MRHDQQKEVGIDFILGCPYDLLLAATVGIDIISSAYVLRVRPVLKLRSLGSSFRVLPRVPWLSDFFPRGDGNGAATRGLLTGCWPDNSLVRDAKVFLASPWSRRRLAMGPYSMDLGSVSRRDR